ncbi:MAG TPA: putative lipid II flippase FtsW [Ignavibacteria bacterium]|nr:putative lipid II flippase FtsW [Ignavibacteria bacterium]HQY51253.1 putative lipid II flippase FtsW [Ignavibacteria bacterium]HRA99939.1 putative lipid II flippase FtsW [Ignavibacteria bacterium]
MSHKYKIDVWILLPVLVLMGISVVAVYSASSTFAMDRFQDSNYLIKQHMIKVGISIILIFLIAKFDYKNYRQFAKYLLWGTIILLILTLFIGNELKGASRWIYLGPFSFQPSELARYFIIMYIALLLAKKKDYLDLLYRGYLPIIFYVLLVSGLILIQPNLSVSLIIFATCMSMLFLSNVKFKHLVITLLSLVPLVVIFILSKDYIIKRIVSYSEHSTGGEGSYQLQQALIGFGNGGLLGIGPGNSNQREYFLPEAHGDFIFSVIGEEYGFIGTFLIIALFFIILYRGYKIAKDTKEDFGKYMAFGITTMIVLNAVVNMAVASGVFPTTGVTLPFVSYGGTSILFSAIAVGILLNISSFRDEINEEITLE